MENRKGKKGLLSCIGCGKVQMFTSEKESSSEKCRVKESITKDPRKIDLFQFESEASSDYALRRASLTEARKWMS